MSYRTEQEEFWSGVFGSEYARRCKGGELVAAKVAKWVKFLNRAEKLDSCLELGSNIGMNEMALGTLFPNIKMTAVEINTDAAAECRKIPNVEVFEGSIFDFETEEKYDLTFTNGVLIHINPEMLPIVYKKLYDYSARYILVAEYYNPTPVEVEYRGNTGRLFKRDFAGEIMDMYSDLKLVEYGFLYHRDIFPSDDATWFLMEKIIRF